MALQGRFGFAETVQNGLQNKIKQAAALRVKQSVVTALTSHPGREG